MVPLVVSALPLGIVVAGLWFETSAHVVDAVALLVVVAVFGSSFHRSRLSDVLDFLLQLAFAQLFELAQ
ncbi:hypothetical protein D3C86_2135930 [compost metagenome]